MKARLVAHGQVHRPRFIWWNRNHPSSISHAAKCRLSSHARPWWVVTAAAIGFSTVGWAASTRVASPIRLESATASGASAAASAVETGSEVKPERLCPRDEIARHRSKDTGVWVTYGTGVYDITAFIEQHPGGSRILMAAGGPLEPFWNVYTIHQKEEVRLMLEQYRIGSVDLARDGANAVPGGAAAVELQVEDPFSGDPVRNPLLVVRSMKPFNAETPALLLADHFITPNDLFYVRNHLPVPHVVGDEYALEVADPAGQLVRFSLPELRSRFTQNSVMATLQCAGNRRMDMLTAGPVQGLSWSNGAIGNAVWTGVYLMDVLKAVGWDDQLLLRQGSHVLFDGLDGYGASVPLHKVMHSAGDVLLAHSMNEEPLPLDHGFPLRAIVPGHVAARSVKWVGRVSVSHEESPSHWQRFDYKGFSPSANWDQLDWNTCKSIQELPVQSAILDPLPGTVLTADSTDLSVKGYAWSGGGRPITRVDLSIDGGKTWTVANLTEVPQQEDNRVWAWCFWECTVPLAGHPDSSSSTLELICKAVDSSYNVQPDSVSGIYNRRGVLSNAWHRVTVQMPLTTDASSTHDHR